jgi:hypothetical protein
MGIVVVAAFAARSEGAPPDVAISECWQSIELAPRPAVFDRDVAALDITVFAQALAERAQTVCGQIRRSAIKKPDNWHCWFLCPRSQRPSLRAAEADNEFAPFHLQSSKFKIAGRVSDSLRHQAPDRRATPNMMPA